MDKDKIKEFQTLIDNSNNIVFFGGAGVSTASGIPDFRSEVGLFNGKQKYKYDVEFMLSHTFYKKHTPDFFDFYRDTMCALGYKPNVTHYKLAQLEEKGKLKAVITQNVDGLHQMAGSKNVIELHGSIHKNHCEICKKQYPAEFIKNSTGIPICPDCGTAGAIVRPDVVLYEEQLPDGAMYNATKYVGMADLLIIAGTSLNVYPAAGLIDYFEGENIVLVNKGSVAKDCKAKLVFDGDMTEVFNSINV